MPRGARDFKAEFHERIERDSDTIGGRHKDKPVFGERHFPRFLGIERGYLKAFNHRSLPGAAPDTPTGYIFTPAICVGWVSHDDMVYVHVYTKESIALFYRALKALFKDKL